MTHRLTTDYAKNYCNRTLIVKVIVENLVTCFWGHSVYRLIVQVANSYPYESELTHIWSLAEDNNPETDVHQIEGHRLAATCFQDVFHAIVTDMSSTVPQCGWVFRVFLCCSESNGYCADSIPMITESCLLQLITDCSNIVSSCLTLLTPTVAIWVQL